MSKFFRHPISPNLSPNATWRDIRFAINAIVNPLYWKHWRRGTAVGRLDQFFMDTYKADFARSFDSGRTALTAILGAVVEPGDKVYIQAFTCIAVPNAVIAAGGTPVFVDIDDTLNLDPEDLKLKIEQHGSPTAIIVQHMFGSPANMKPIEAITDEHKAYLIEDCAHTIGSHTPDGRLVGTIGHAAMFSFGRDKPISAVSGGAAIANNPTIGAALNTYWNSLEQPPRWWIWQRFNHPLIFALAKPVYHFFSLGKVIITLSKKLGFFPLVLTRKEKGGTQAVGMKLPNALADWALLQLAFQPAMNRHRQALAQTYYYDLLQDTELGEVLTHPQPPTGDQPVAPLRYPLMLNTESSPLLMKMRADGILLGKWYKTVIAPKDASYESVGYELGSCPRAEAACVGIINLPTNITTSPDDADAVLASLKKYLKS